MKNTLSLVKSKFLKNLEKYLTQTLTLLPYIHLIVINATILEPHEPSYADMLMQFIFN